MYELPPLALVIKSRDKTGQRVMLKPGWQIVVDHRAGTMSMLAPDSKQILQPVTLVESDDHEDDKYFMTALHERHATDILMSLLAASHGYRVLATSNDDPPIRQTTYAIIA